MQNPQDFIRDFKARLFETTPKNFEQRALEAFRFQAKHNAVYQQFISYLGVEPQCVNNVPQIPFMPIEFFKNHRVLSTHAPIEQIFESSGTTGQVRSKHFVTDTAFYLRTCEQIFQQHYGKLSDFTFLALLPSYLERDGSSLVCMMDYFIQKGAEYSGFYLHNIDELILNLKAAKYAGKKVMLWGVTFALLDLAEQHDLDLEGVIVVETGGMKGRRQEMIREELHAFLCRKFHISTIHSEYGMTELFSQGYSAGNGIFTTPPWLKILLRDPNDPFDMNISRKRGGINVVDLANIDSCCFIETKDMGEYDQNLTFRVLGRLDNSDVRGCNLMLYF
ncbi:Acyl-protein synthetase, LuxE [Flexibacter flexilis DSM 6793]|uniref:Acyl-protein synthetase, LuxE n=1 Tax=Flexibacter flexilis DSM 6793 TaxID=927664 RepID=A0A1I1I9M9_9BACT|nr:acyl transferase [Flexibacter flexilis]SFC32907.1 Acyl-protein synthetase, LuxE [Flexibacter flexilis DSM 6793]